MKTLLLAIVCFLAFISPIFLQIVSLPTEKPVHFPEQQVTEAADLAVGTEYASEFLETVHVSGSGGSLRGAIIPE